MTTWKNRSIMWSDFLLCNIPFIVWLGSNGKTRRENFIYFVCCLVVLEWQKKMCNFRWLLFTKNAPFSSTFLLIMIEDLSSTFPFCNLIKNFIFLKEKSWFFEQIFMGKQLLNFFGCIRSTKFCVRHKSILIRNWSHILQVFDGKV